MRNVRRRSRTGFEPVTARSALGLRLLLSVLFAPLFLAGTVLFALWAAEAGPRDVPAPGSLRTLAWICAALTLLSLVDLGVVLTRRRRQRRGPRDR